MKLKKIYITDADGNKIGLGELTKIFGLHRSTIYRWYVDDKCKTLSCFVSCKGLQGKYFTRCGKYYETVLGKMRIYDIYALTEGTKKTVTSRMRVRGSMCQSIFFTDDREKYKEQCKVHGIVIYRHKNRNKAIKPGSATNSKCSSKFAEFDRVLFCCKGDVVGNKCNNYNACQEERAMAGVHSSLYKEDGSCWTKK